MLGICLAAAALHAEEKPKAAVSQDAQTLFERAVRAYEAGLFRDAVDLFKDADQLAPSALLSFNIAKAYERMSDTKNALAAYRDYLRRLPQAENRLETSQRIAELELSLQKQGVQQLSVFSVPSGATLVIDDVSRGVTPWTGELPPGAHRIAIRLRDYRDAVKEIELPVRNAIDVNFQLEPATPLDPVLPPQDLTPEPTPPPPPAPEVDKLPRWWTWALFGGSAALLAGAGGMELSRQAAEDEYPNSAQVDRRRKFDAIDSRKTTARVLLGAGIGVGVLGGVSLFFDLRRDPSSPNELGLACEGGACRVLTRGRW
jgi:tetratricopeptide (TPR) repeat protein